MKLFIKKDGNYNMKTSKLQVSFEHEYRLIGPKMSIVKMATAGLIEWVIFF